MTAPSTADTLSIWNWMVLGCAIPVILYGLFLARKQVDETLRSLVLKGMLTAVICLAYLGLIRPLAAKGGGSALIALMLSVGMGFLLALAWTRILMDVVTQPIIGLFAGGEGEQPETPYYAAVKGHRKRGEPEKALQALEQLAEGPRDQAIKAMLESCGAGDAKWRDGKTAVYVFNAGEDVGDVINRYTPTHRCMSFTIPANQGVTITAEFDAEDAAKTSVAPVNANLAGAV